MTIEDIGDMLRELLSIRMWCEAGALVLLASFLILTFG